MVSPYVPCDLAHILLSRPTIRVESVFDLFEQRLSGHKLVDFQSPSIACGNMFSIVLVKPLLQNTQDILLFEDKTALKISESAIYGKGLAAVLERCKVGISKLEVAYCCRCQQARQDMFVRMVLT